MSHPHDVTNKELFSHPEFVQQLFEDFVPPHISKLLNYQTLTIHSGNFITPLFDEKFEDVVWSVQLNNSNNQIYLYILLKFQSSRDITMPLRMLHYTASFYHQLIKNEKIKLHKDKLPPVFPMVLYSGDAPWQVPTNMLGLIRSVPSFFKPYLPQQQYYLLDEQRFSFEELEHKKHPLSHTFAVKKARSKDDTIRTVLQLMQSALEHPDAKRIAPIISRWLKHHLHHNNIDINLETIESLQELNHMLATKYEYAVQEGRQEGLNEGHLEAKQQMAKKLLAMGTLSNLQIAEVTELSLADIEAIKESL